MVDVVRHHERMIGVEPNVRIEHGPITWVIYTRDAIGLEKDASGNVTSHDVPNIIGLPSALDEAAINSAHGL
jgi:hypothetical protein